MLFWLVFHISAVTEMHQFDIIDEKNERRRCYTDLCAVENIKTAPFIRRCRIHAYTVDDHFVERTGFHTLLMGIIHEIDQRENSGQTIS